MKAHSTADQHRYFVAIIPPQPIFDELLLFKHYLKEKYHSKAALNSPPHITIQMPFWWPNDKINILTNSLDNFAKGRQAISIELNGFGCFAPHTLFLSVNSNPALHQLESDLTKFCDAHLNLKTTSDSGKKFHPHATVAFRDLAKEKFTSAWAEFENKSYKASFRVTSITVLQHNETNWQPFHQCNF